MITIAWTYFVCYILTTRVIQHIRCHCRNYSLVYMIFRMCFDNISTIFRQCFGNALIYYFNKNQLPLDIHSYKRNINVTLQHIYCRSIADRYTQTILYATSQRFTQWQCNLVSYYMRVGDCWDVSMYVYWCFTKLEIGGACHLNISLMAANVLISFVLIFIIYPSTLNTGIQSNKKFIYLRKQSYRCNIHR